MRLSGDRPFLIIGHRGMPNHAPENTVASFDKALEMGFNHLELDAQLTADGVVVVFHDATLDRTTNGSGPLASNKLAQLKCLDAGGWFSDAFSGQQIPTLEEVLVRYHGRAYLYLELKSQEPELPRAVAELMVKTGWRTAASAHLSLDWPRVGITVISFHLAQLQGMRALLPEAPLAWLVQELSSEIVDAAAEEGLQAVCPRVGSVTSQGVRAAWARCLAVLAWGARTNREFAELARCGVQGAVSDWPDITRQHLRQMGIPTCP